MNSSVNDRKRRFVSLSKTKKIRRTQLINNSKNQRIIHLNENTSNLIIPKQDDQTKQNSVNLIKKYFIKFFFINFLVCCCFTYNNIIGFNKQKFSSK